ncbi:GNAT family N-acetyltransferase [Saccharibacillus endophyticus]|uniref:GNAT family N-acetyltransferase n=1 Tax=Saccharibacillus endophyticus TaxID=2060666 RepID=UPI001556F11E|nr:GNAT family N-acetyltransferase [Saccharibacillus endophyticus]
MTVYRWERANQEEFAVNQVVYSNADIEMWYDWTAQLNDTKFTEDCFWVVEEGRRIGGILKLGDTLMYPFLIPPFSDREKFWTGLLGSLGEKVAHINGVMQQDADILLARGFESQVVRRVMCSPASSGKMIALAEGYSLHPFDGATDLNEIQELIRSAYTGSLDYEIFGTPSDEELRGDIQYLLDVYRQRNLSVYVADKHSGKPIGVCIAGVGEKMPLGFAEIAEIGVEPSHRGRGIAELMLHHVKHQARPYTDVVKLCVTVGNPAENLYRKAGFQGGPSFAKMSRMPRANMK